MGITTRPWETRDRPCGGEACAAAARKARICARWMAANEGSSSGSGKMTLLESRLNPFAPAHAAERLPPAPYHNRSRSPGECGSTRSENSSTTPCLPENVRSGSPETIRARRSTRP